VTTLAVLALFAVHLGLVAHFSPRGLFSLPAPLLTSAFAVEAYRAERAWRAFAESGHFAGYDPRVLGGRIAGLHELLGTRVEGLGTVLLARLGVAPASAFDAMAVALHALVPVVGYAAARAFGAGRRLAAGTLALWSALTFVDSVTHFAWFSGRVAWVLASGVVVLQAALVERALPERRASLLAALGASGFVAVLLHPVAALFGVVVMLTWLSLNATPEWRRGPVAVAIAAPVGLAWLLFCRSDLASSEPVQTVFHVGPASVLWDLVEIPGPGYGAAGASRTLLRTLCFVAAGLWTARRGDRSGTVPSRLVVVLAFAFVLIAYTGILLPVSWSVDPYFFVIGGTFAASLPAMELVGSLPWADIARRGPTAVRVALLVAVAVVVPRAVRTVLTYAPELLPARVVRGPSDLAVSALGGVNEPFPDPLGYDPAPPGLPALADYLVTHGAGAGRVLTDDAAVAGFLALRTSLHVLGPLGERGTPFASADPSPLFDGAHDARAVAAYLERYAVVLVVLGGPPGPFDANDALLEPPARVAGYRVRRVAAPSAFVLSGVGKVAAANPDHSIGVEGAAGPRITLRFHYDARLACRPGCTVERAAIDGDVAGFVSVPDPPASFVISY
jgi:hypothetical protein